MPSKLFQVATARERRQARYAFGNSPLRKAVRDIASIRRQSGGQAIKSLYRAVARPEVRQLITQLESTLGGGVVKYSGKDEQKQALNRLLDALGPIGNVIKGVVAPNASYTRDSFDAAVELVRAFGGEVLVGKGRPGYERGVEAAKQLLEEAGYTVVPPGERNTTPGNLEDRPHVSSDGEPTGWLADAEQRVNSSSVWSYAFQQETEKYGTLYVTFLAWTPGTGKLHSPGATYAYYDVTLAKYRAFKRDASRSAGEAVWDHLRVRGSVWEHQVPYEMVGGVKVQDQGVYVPRKATEKGYMRRSIQDPYGPRGRWVRSALPSREHLPPRGEANRGTPNRG